jgi:AbrB family looped-hinge helix DNA binding protein
MESAKVKVGGGGRVVIPAEYRKFLEVEPGDEVIIGAKDGELRIWTQAIALRRAQELIRKHVPEGVSLVDELIQDRREEAALEAAE